MKKFGLSVLGLAMILVAGLAGSVQVSAAEVEALTLDVDYDYDYIDATEYRWVHYSSPRISVTTDGYGALDQALADYSDSKLAYAKAQTDDFVEWIQAEDVEDPLEYMDYYQDSQILMRRADSLVTSFCNVESSFAGGAHPNYWYSPLTLDSATGTKLELADVVQDPEALPELLEEKLLEKYDAEMFLTDKLAEDIRQEMQPSGTYLDYVTGEEVPFEAGPLFTLEPCSITFWFSPYELTSYAAGGVTVTLAFDSYPDLVKPEYQQAAESWFVPLEMNEEIRLPGEDTTLSWSAEATDEYDSEWIYRITVNGVTREDEIWTFNSDAYLMHTSGKNFLVFKLYMEDDYQLLRVTDLNGLSAISSPDEIPEAEIIYDTFAGCPTNPESCVLNRGLDLLSTYTMGRRYRFTADGTIEALEPWYTIYDHSNEYYEMALTLKRSLDVDAVDEESGEVIGSVSLTPGIKLHFVRTDGETWVDMRTPKGRLVRLYVNGTWPQSVNGLNAEDVFDGMMFAG